MVIWPWPWIFKVKFWKCCISGLEGPIDMERKGCESIGCYTHFVTVNVPLTHDLDLGFSRSNFEKVVSQEWDGRLTWTKGMWVNRMLHLLCDFQCPPHPWPWPWIFKVKFWKCCISGMEGPIDMEQKRCESIGCYTHFVTFNIPLTHDLDLGFSRSNFENVYLRNGRADWHGTKAMWIDRMLHPLCDCQHSPHPWPWPWIFKVKIWKSRISGMGWPIDMEWKGCESIGCYTHFVTLNVHFTHDLDLRFSRSNFENAVSQE